MKKRILSLFMVLVMLVSLMPTQIFALENALGDGSAENPYQIGDVVLNDGTAAPEGVAAENAVWVRTSDVPASETLICQLEEHDHSACAVNAVAAACALEDHPTEGELLTWTHPDGTVCTYNAEQAIWTTQLITGYACGMEAHTHTLEAGCISQTAAYTVWTLTAVEPAAEEPIAEEPAAEEPIAEEPAAEEPIAEEPAAEEPIAEEPAAEEPIAEEPAAEEPIAEEPAAEEPIAEEPAAEEPIAEEPAAEEPIAEEPAAEEAIAEEPAAEEPIAEEPAEYVCVEGCILTGEEHDECFVWVPCQRTEGCEGPEGHEGECYGIALYASEGATITISTSRARSKYIVIHDGTSDTVYYVNSSGVVETLAGEEAIFPAGTYKIYYGPSGTAPNRNKTVYYANVTVSDSDTAKTVTLSSEKYTVHDDDSDTHTYNADQYRYAMSIYYNVSSFNHIHVRVEGSYVIHVSGHEYTATVSNPSMIVNVNGAQAINHSWSDAASYEWTYSAQVSRSSLIEVILTFDLTYTDANGNTVVLEDVSVSYDNANDRHKYYEAIAICDGVEGLDFIVSIAEIEEEIQYYNVSYEWKVYNTDGTFTELPAGAPSEPASTSGHAAGENYVYDTDYVTGTSFYDYDNGLLYSFHGWDTYSHSSNYDVDPTAEGYYALDDGDTDGSNNPTITITNDTYIYGYWTVTELTPASAYIVIDKVIAGLDGDAAALADAQLVWFRVDTGYDGDGDGLATVDVDYSQILAVKQSATGEYRLPVYQYDTPFVVTEHNADVPGYTVTTTIAVTGDRIQGDATAGSTVNLTLAPQYLAENVHLGTVTYTNTYTKIMGDPVSVYPALTLMKSAADQNGLFQDGVEFTLYTDAACTDVLGTYVTADGGLATIDFTGLAAGTYYLMETDAAPGYIADTTVYPVTLSAANTVEELRWNATALRYEFVEVTTYTLSVEIPDTSDAMYTHSGTSYFRLHVYNSPILGSVNVEKTAIGLADQTDLEAVVIIHGPITRDSNGDITDIGSTWQLTLNAANLWKDLASELPLGEYLIHESFASVHGYTWTGVTYQVNGADLATTVYNNITSGLFNITEAAADIDLEIINTYVQWASADFYIRKQNESGTALAGAAFQLYSDESCDAATAIGIPISTGADGYAHFEGFTVSASDPDGIATYYLQEVKAPAGYYLSDTVYKVEIKAVTDAVTNVTSFETKISVKDGTGAWVEANFNPVTDLLTVVNYPVTGSLTVNKTITSNFPTDNGIPYNLSGVTVDLSGPNGFYRSVVLNADNNWTYTWTGLALGEYTVIETNAAAPGYSLSVKYTVGATETTAEADVILAEANPGYTVPGTAISGAVAIRNDYTRNEETFEIPTSLTIKKVDEDGVTALKGAVFTLVRQSDNQTFRYTTNENGIVVFDLLSGSVDTTTNPPSAVDGTYILSEETAPEGYAKSNITWTVTVTDEDGIVRIELNENKNLFENFWDWIIGGITGTDTTGWSWDNTTGYLTIRNTKLRGDLTVTKAVTDELNRNADAAYAFTVTLSDRADPVTFTLKAGENKVIENIPYGTTYTVTEDLTGAAFTNVITDAGNGLIWAENTDVTVENTYEYDRYNLGLNLLKADSETAEAIEGAEFTLYADAALETVIGTGTSDANGQLNIPITAAGTYYLQETKAAEGYHPNSTVYTVTAEEAYVVLDAGTDHAVTEIRMLITVAGLDGTAIDALSYRYTVKNTAIKIGDITVKKVWEDGGYHDRPTEVEATLYRDNVAFDTVKLNEANGWSHIWKDLTDEYIWSVDEVNVPAEYVKSVVNNGADWTITNTRTPNPVEITVTKAWVHNGGKNLPASIEVTLYENGDAYETVELNEANNWTYTWKNLTDVSVWSVDEVNVPTGYEKKLDMDGYKFTITNTRIINPVEVSVTKAWVASESVAHPEYVEAVLYRDGAAYDTVKLNAANDWSYTWKDLTDEYTWSVDEKSIPAGYTKNVTNQGNDFTITNTKIFTYVDVSVNKVWYGADVTHPGSVDVTLYRDGVAYETVKLSAANNWSYTWKNLTDEFQWEVDEPSVPSGYNKTVRRNGYAFTITNTHVDNPKTGDASNMLLWMLLSMLSVVGFVATGAAVLAPEKKRR